MRLPPAIFSVLAFRSVDDGRIECRSHLVAACNDQEAESVIVASGREHLAGARCFVQTTENNQIHQTPAVRLYVDATRSELVSEQEFARWVQTSTVKSFDGSESYPATFREFAVPFSDRSEIIQTL
jgi:hypothetical protein